MKMATPRNRSVNVERLLLDKELFVIHEHEGNDPTPTQTITRSNGERLNEIKVGEVLKRDYGFSDAQVSKALARSRNL